jgi:squalene monooxygenase
MPNTSESRAPTTSISAPYSSQKLDSTKPKADYREVRRRVHHEADIVIVGAGIAGCAAAVAFGKQGRSVILLEKSLKEPDRIVGELLQPGGVLALERLGLRGMISTVRVLVS